MTTRFLRPKLGACIDHSHTGRKTLSSRHSTISFSKNVVVMETGYQMLDVLSFCNR